MATDVFDNIVGNMYAEHKKVLKADSLVAGAILTFVFIDSMAKVGLSHDGNVTKCDFIQWVDDHLKTPVPYEYQYVGKDVYKARCAMLHTFSPGHDLTAKRFGYQDGSPHRYRAEVDASLVMISVPLLVDDFYKAVAQFVKSLRGRADFTDVEARFAKMYQHIPFRGKGST